MRWKNSTPDNMGCSNKSKFQPTNIQKRKTKQIQVLQEYRKYIEILGSTSSLAPYKFIFSGSICTKLTAHYIALLASVLHRLYIFIGASH
jgi:hypothetical protein